MTRHCENKDPCPRVKHNEFGKQVSGTEALSFKINSVSMYPPGCIEERLQMLCCRNMHEFDTDVQGAVNENGTNSNATAQRGYPVEAEIHTRYLQCRQSTKLLRTPSEV